MMSTQPHLKAMKHYVFRRSKLTYGSDKGKEAAGVPEQAKLADAVASEAYWAACKHRVTLFVDLHYRWPGVYALHRTALGLDLLKAPINVLLALPAVVVPLEFIRVIDSPPKRPNVMLRGTRICIVVTPKLPRPALRPSARPCCFLG